MNSLEPRTNTIPISVYSMYSQNNSSANNRILLTQRNSKHPLLWSTLNPPWLLQTKSMLPSHKTIIIIIGERKPSSCSNQSKITIAHISSKTKWKSSIPQRTTSPLDRTTRSHACRLLTNSKFILPSRLQSWAHSKPRSEHTQRTNYPFRFQKYNNNQPNFRIQTVLML